MEPSTVHCQTSLACFEHKLSDERSQILNKFKVSTKSNVLHVVIFLGILQF